MAAPTGAVILGTTDQKVYVSDNYNDMYAYLITRAPVAPWWCDASGDSRSFPPTEFTIHYGAAASAQMYVEVSLYRYWKEFEMLIEGSGATGDEQLATYSASKRTFEDAVDVSPGDDVYVFCWQVRMIGVTRSETYQNFYGISFRSVLGDDTVSSALDGFEPINRNDVGSRIYEPGNFLSAYHGMSVISDTIDTVQSALLTMGGVPIYGGGYYT